VKILISSIIIIAVLADALLLAQPVKVTDNAEITNKVGVIRFGYFPNINHAIPIVGLARNSFKDAFPDIEIKASIFNAGPSAIEALFADQIDLAYIGPNPAINGYIKSNGALKIIAGAASGGAVFVVRNDSDLWAEADFAGMTFASPQLGNTQDVALRTFILNNGYRFVEQGGNVRVIPVQNPDIFVLFLKKEIDGAWVPEPWGARLVREANGRIFLDERQLWPNGKFVTAQLIVRTKFLEEHPELVERWLRVHVDMAQWINDNKAEAATILNGEIKRITGQALNEDVLTDALSRIEITYNPIKQSLFKLADDAYKLGYLGEKKPDLSNIYDLRMLNSILSEKKLQQIQG
jgi:NitT/TauT family transport system substrate-binding protein